MVQSSLIQALQQKGSDSPDQHLRQLRLSLAEKETFLVLKNDARFCNLPRSLIDGRLKDHAGRCNNHAISSFPRAEKYISTTQTPFICCIMKQ